MITKLFVFADVHIERLARHDEYREQLKKLTDAFRSFVETNGKENCLGICIGDLVHSKLDISNEQMALVADFLKEMNEIGTLILVAGNHDLSVTNLSRMDTLTPIVDMCECSDLIYLDKMMDYKSGAFDMDNIVFVLYSIFDEFRRPDIEKLRQQYPHHTFVGLYHGTVNGCSDANGWALNDGIDAEKFDGLDMALCGHIHLRQTFRTKSNVLVHYTGSVVCRNFGENVSWHGYSIIDVGTKQIESVDIPSEYGYYKFEINSEDDVDNDKEVIKNL